jgi:PKD repeat protein
VIGAQLTVPITQQDLGKSITFWCNGGEALPRVQISASGGMMELPLEFTHAGRIGDIILHGSVRANGMVAPVGTVISASIDGVTRTQHAVTDAGRYGALSPGALEFVIPVTELDIGKSITFSIGGIRADQTFFVQTGGTFTLDLTGTDQPVLIPTSAPQPGPGLVAALDAAPRSGSAPLTVHFVDLSIGNPSLWVWNFGDGSPQSLESNPVHTFTHPGMYTVTLEVANSEFFDSISMPHYITVSGIIAAEQPSTVASGTLSLNLYPGWNFISFPTRLAPGSDTAMIFNDVNGAGHSIFAYDAATQQWKTLRSDSQLQAMSAIWIYSQDAMTMPLQPNQDPLQTPPVKQVYKGWNAVGPGTSPLEARYSFLSIQDEWINSLGYNNQNQQYDDMVIKGMNDERTLYPGNGYWLFMNTDGILAGSSA